MRKSDSLQNTRFWLTVLAATVGAFVIVALLGFPAWGGPVVFAVMLITGVIYAAIVTHRRRR